MTDTIQNIKKVEELTTHVDASSVSNGIHNLLIWTIIIVIVIIQFRIYNKAKGKIKTYNRILPAATTFKTVKIFVREDELTDLTLEKLYKNLKEYKNGNLEKRKRKYDEENNPFKVIDLSQEEMDEINKKLKS